MKKHLILIALLFSLGSAYGRGYEHSIAKRDSIRNTYIGSYADMLGLYAYGIQKSNSFEVIDIANSKHINYNANENFNLGLGFNYKWLGLGLAFNFGAINNDDDLYGDTRSLDLQADMFPKGWLISINFQWYNGFYWSDPNVFFPNWELKDSVYTRSDISTFSMGVSGVYALNKNKFSYKAPFVNTEEQKKSAGSLLLGGSYSIYAIEAKQALLPDYVIDQYPEVADLSGLNSVLMGVLVGYSYTLILKKHFYTNLTATLGLNAQSISSTSAGGVKNNASKFSNNAVLRFGMGYNKPKYYFGFTAIGNSFLLQNSPDVNFNYGYGKFRIFYGRRFDGNDLKKAGNFFRWFHSKSAYTEE